MSHIEKKLKLSDEKFKCRIGTTKPVFHTMLGFLQTAHDKLYEQGGKGERHSIAVKFFGGVISAKW